MEGTWAKRQKDNNMINYNYQRSFVDMDKSWVFQEYFRGGFESEGAFAFAKFEGFLHIFQNLCSVIS